MLLSLMYFGTVGVYLLLYCITVIQLSSHLYSPLYTFLFHVLPLSHASLSLLQKFSTPPLISLPCCHHISCYLSFLYFFLFSLASLSFSLPLFPTLFPCMCCAFFMCILSIQMQFMRYLHIYDEQAGFEIVPCDRYSSESCGAKVAVTRSW